MSKRIVVREPGKPQFVITYYGVGQTPMYLYFDDPVKAVSEFERMADDPYASVVDLELRQTILHTKYVF